MEINLEDEFLVEGAIFKVISVFQSNGEKKYTLISKSENLEIEMVVSEKFFEKHSKKCKCIRFVGGNNWYPNGCEIHK
jgi:hypothetical protein